MENKPRTETHEGKYENCWNFAKIFVVTSSFLHETRMHIDISVPTDLNIVSKHAISSNKNIKVLRHKNKISCNICRGKKCTVFNMYKNNYNNNKK